MRNIIVLCCVVLLSQTLYSQILPLQKRAEVIDEVLKDRFDNLLPSLMDRADIDMWVLISREYNEDPVLRTMLPATWLNARRRTILVFYIMLAIILNRLGKKKNNQINGKHYSKL